MFSKLILASIILALVVVMLGAYTRLSDAGLGCPDWPGCYGQIIVPDVVSEEYTRPLDLTKAWTEMIHRYAAALLGLAIMVIFVLALMKKTQRPQSPLLPSFLVLMVLFQGALGMWTVTELVHPGIVSMHLIGGFMITSLLLWLALNQAKIFKIYQRILKRHKLLMVVSLIVLLSQIILGGWVSTNYAALSCGNSFPTCLGSWWPAMNFADAFYWGKLGVDYEYGVLENPVRSAIQVTHRIGALVTILVLGFLIYLLMRYTHLRHRLVLVAVVLFIQVILGILNVVLSLPIALAVAHNAVALLLLLSLVALIHKAFHASV